MLNQDSPPDSWAGFMQEAIALAEKGRWHTAPNPAVGCVLVRDGQILARGWHAKAGTPHAERKCLQDALENGVETRGATLVVTLEPCNHFGKTPPCTQAILEHGIKHVVYGLADPNPKASGGAAMLREHGVAVTGPVLEAHCRELVRDFLTWQCKQRPFFILKLAATMDGRIATRTGASQWITSAESRECVQDLREQVALTHGAVLVGGRTFRQDNPRLTVRKKGTLCQPLACVLTSQLPDAAADYHLLKRNGDTIFFVPETIAQSRETATLQSRGLRVFPLPGESGDLDLQVMAKLLYDLGCPYVLCEGGSTLATKLLNQNLIDLFHLHLAPLFFADNDALPILNGNAPKNVQDGLAFETLTTTLCQNDVHIILRPVQR